MFFCPNFGIAKSFGIGLHGPTSLAELGGNFKMCQWEEEQLVSNMDVVCATPCFVEIKDSSMHALLALVSGQGIT